MRRRGSVLVLVMTLLSILFVLGITFLATMNFEADMIAAEKRRGGGEHGAATLFDGFGGVMRGGFIDSGGSPFGGSGKDRSGATFAELPGVHNVFSSIEPSNLAGGDGVSGTNDDFNPAFASFTDASRGSGIPVPHGVLLSSTLRNGESIPNFQSSGMSSPASLLVCRGGVNKKFICGTNDDCPGSTCSGPVAVDADGDGIVDSFLSDASDAGLAPDQIAKLSVQVNEPGSEKTAVFVGLRAISHGGMANLNASHPTIIEAALGLSDDGLKLIDADGSFLYYSLLHRPSGNPKDADYAINESPRSFYSPSSEESLLRRRGMIPPRIFPPSTLHGDPFLTNWKSELNPAVPYGGDMAEYLFWQGATGGTETVEKDKHRFEMFSADEIATGSILRWSTRMDPFVAGSAVEYDRRHLVTTISHDDLLARGGMVEADGAGAQDIIAKMFEINLANLESGTECPDLFPFEYLRYPHELSDVGDCCPFNGVAQFDKCEVNVRKGRLQVSLAWIDAQLAEARFLRTGGNPNDAYILEQRVERVVYDAFYLMIRNAVGEDWVLRPVCDIANNFQCQKPGTICKLSALGAIAGRCSASAAYFDDVECTIPGFDSDECAAGEFCSPINYTPDETIPTYLCSDKWTRQRRSQSRLTRTAASLTANLFDFADNDGTPPRDNIPMRIAIRMMDFDMGVCLRGEQAGRVCLSDLDCPGSRCNRTEWIRGQAFDFDENEGLQSLFVYGLERQPYITEVATLQAKDAVVNSAWWVELFNPYGDPAPLNDYRIRQYDETGILQGDFPLAGTIPPSLAGGPVPFTVLATDPIGAITIPGAIPIPALSFKEGWTLYLIRRVKFADENPPFALIDFDIVVDQFTVPQGVGAEGTPCPTDPVCLFVAGRGVAPTTPWTATVPSLFGPIDTHSLGGWNGPSNTAAHPVEVNFANSGAFADTTPYEKWLPGNLANPTAVSFPTTGSMLLLMRHANRAIGDMTDKLMVGGLPLDPITELAFTTSLVGDVSSYTIRYQVGSATPQHFVNILAEQQIDNGRMPIFDLGEDTITVPNEIGPQATHHVPAHLMPEWNTNPQQPQESGGLENLPWGQLLFDYFTTIPLDSPGPFPPCTGGNYTCAPAGSPNAKPRVDLDGLRVHGRINLNAAPATILAGLPFMPIQEFPLAFRAQLRVALGFVEPTALDPLNPLATDLLVFDDEAGVAGFNRAQAIVAYRDARQIRYGGLDTGDYGVVTDPDGTITGTQSFGWRGWTDTKPAVRRGTGFMTVGELANVRHSAATLIFPPPKPGFPESVVRLDGGIVDDHETARLNPTNDNNDENFIAAAAFLIALNDWATVRSHVFTIYGHIRGAEDSEITDANLRRKDVDSRAIRFQETVDRLPTFLGKSLPTRIGGRTVGAYLDQSND